MIFLHSLQEQFKVISLELANLAEVLQIAYNENPKWQSNYRIKITHFWDFDQTNLILQTKATG